MAISFWCGLARARAKKSRALINCDHHSTPHTTHTHTPIGLWDHSMSPCNSAISYSPLGEHKITRLFADRCLLIVRMQCRLDAHTHLTHTSNACSMRLLYALSLCLFLWTNTCYTCAAHAFTSCPIVVRVCVAVSAAPVANAQQTEWSETININISSSFINICK